MNFQKLVNDIKNIRIPILIIVIYMIITNYFFDTVCPSVILFHHECPACGLTRACLCLMTFRFQQALAYNPSVIFWIVLIVVGFVSRYIKKIPNIFIYVLMIITGLLTIALFYLIGKF